MFVVLYLLFVYTICMTKNKPYRWNEDKNKAIKKRHGLQFEMLLSLQPIYFIEKHNPQKLC